MPDIRRMVLFGSLARGSATTRSDADLLVIVERSPFVDPRDRFPELLASMAPLPGPVDAFVVTEEEFERHRTSSPLLREAVAYGVDLLPADAI